MDAEDNVWICDANGATVMKICPDGKLLMTIGDKGHRGDWDRSQGTTPVLAAADVAFAQDGSSSISAKGMPMRAPMTSTPTIPPTVRRGAHHPSRPRTASSSPSGIGDDVGQGKFDFRPTAWRSIRKNGDVWIGDREQYRIVVYTGDGQFVKTIQMRNLACTIDFDHDGNPWMGQARTASSSRSTATARCWALSETGAAGTMAS